MTLQVNLLLRQGKFEKNKNISKQNIQKRYTKVLTKGVQMERCDSFNYRSGNLPRPGSKRNPLMTQRTGGDKKKRKTVSFLYIPEIS